MKKLLAALGLSLFASASQAAVVAYTWEENGNVHSNWSGTLDTTGLDRFQTTNGSTSGIPRRSFIQPHRTYFFNMVPDYYGYRGLTDNAASLGASSTAYHGEFKGDGFGYLTDRNYLYLPQSYQSGAFMSGVSRIAGVTLAQMGIKYPFTYSMNWKSDSITHHWGVNPYEIQAVPVPAGLPLMAAVLGAFAWMRRRKKA